MAFEYTLDKVNKLGDYDDTYGQRYWCESPDEEKPISFNIHEDIGIDENAPTVSITAEERVEKQSKKGTVYYQLKKVKISGSPGNNVPTDTRATQGSGSPQSATAVSQLDRIEAKLDKLLGNDETLL